MKSVMTYPSASRAISIHEPMVQFLSRPLTGKVVSVHGRALNLQVDDGGILTLVDPSLGNGPGALLVPHVWPLPWTEGSIIRVEDGWLHGPDLAIRWQGARLWNPPALPYHEYGRTQLEGAVRALAGMGNRSGILPAALSRLGQSELRPHGLAGIFHDMALKGIDQLSQARIDGLVGLGPGLTPSGDDLICGYMTLLSRAGKSITGLRQAMETLSPSATHPLSLHLLRWALEGVAGEHHITWVDALLSGDMPLASYTLERVLAHGATSGADWAAGALLALHHLIEENEDGGQVI